VEAGSGGFVINGQTEYDYSGRSVSAAGDVNGDGLADLIVGASGADPASGTDAGKSYVVFGKTGTTAIDLSAVAAGIGGFVINGQAATDYSGFSVSSAGDVNGDGLADLIVGAYSADPAGRSVAGKSYVVFGKTGTTAIDLSAVEAGSGGFVINGQSAGDSSGISVSAAGDVNGDGLADLIVGAVNADPAGRLDAGKSYVIFGATDGAFASTAVDWLGTSANETRAATAAGQTLVGGAGNDTLSAWGATVLYGGSDDDSFVLDAAMITALQTNSVANGVLARVDGGGGFDTIRLDGGLTLDLTQIANQAASNPDGGSRIDSVEIIDLVAGSGNAALILTALDVLDMSSFNVFQATGRQQLLVQGDTGDTLDLAGGTGTVGWTQAGIFAFGSETYNIWNSDSVFATVYVDDNMTVI
jgi:hypothetical protein